MLGSMACVLGTKEDSQFHQPWVMGLKVLVERLQALPDRGQAPDPEPARMHATTAEIDALVMLAGRAGKQARDMTVEAIAKHRAGAPDGAVSKAWLDRQVERVGEIVGSARARQEPREDLQEAFN